MSDKRRDFSGEEPKSIFERCKKIVFCYLLAVAIYQIIATHFFDVKKYLQNILLFNLSGPFYFVLLYIQLMILSKFLYRILCKANHSLKKEGIYSIGVIFLAFLTTNYTNVFDVYGGGGRLFGGTYLILFWLGLVLAHHDVFQYISMKHSSIFAAVFFLFSVLWWRFMCIDKFNIDLKLPFGIGINPPSISLIVMAVFMLCFCFFIFSCMENGNRFWEKISDVFSSIGKKSLYIFLFHRLILDYFLVPYIKIENIHLKRFVYLTVILLGCLCICQVFSIVKDKYVKCMKRG